MSSTESAQGSPPAWSLGLVVVQRLTWQNAWKRHLCTRVRGQERRLAVSVNAFLANSTNEPAPIAPSKRRRFRQRKPAASG